MTRGNVTHLETKIDKLEEKKTDGFQDGEEAGGFERRVQDIPLRHLGLD